MATIKITYFDLVALGEPIRLLLAYGGEEFEDERVTMENWVEVKPTTPFGQLPVYEENCKVIWQSLAIMGYLGKKYKLIGANPWEDLEIDAMADTVMDFLYKIAVYHYEDSASAKAAKKEVMYKEVLPFYLEHLEKITKDNNGYLAIKKLTWVDIFFAGVVKYMSLMAKVDIFENNPNLNAVHDNVFKLPAITKWYEKHPLLLEGTIKFLESTGIPCKE